MANAILQTHTHTADTTTNPGPAQSTARPSRNGEIETGEKNECKRKDMLNAKRRSSISYATNESKLCIRINERPNERPNEMLHINIKPRA